MARIIICDDDTPMTARLVLALQSEGHDARLCRHTMDMLRDATGGACEMVALGLDMPGFGATGAIETLRELAPRVLVIGFHRDPVAFAVSASNAHHPLKVLPRFVSNENFLRVVKMCFDKQALAALTLPRPSPSHRPATRDSIFRSAAARPRHLLRLYDE